MHNTTTEHGNKLEKANKHAVREWVVTENRTGNEDNKLSHSYKDVYDQGTHRLWERGSVELLMK